MPRLLLNLSVLLWLSVRQCNAGDALIMGSCSVSTNAVLSNTPLCRDTLGNAIACEAFAADAAGWTCTAVTGSGIVAVALCCAGSAASPALQVLNFDDLDASSLPVLNSQPSYGGFKWGG
jgi:hypothetical protein